MGDCRDDVPLHSHLRISKPRIGKGGLCILPAAGAVFATMLTISYTLRSETKTTEFSTQFIFEWSSRKPIWGMGGLALIYVPPMSVIATQNLSGTHPDLFKSDGKQVDSLYMQYAIRVVLDTIFVMFPSHWDMKINKSGTTFPESMRFVPFSDALTPGFATWETVAELFGDLPILKAAPAAFEKMGYRMALF